MDMISQPGSGESYRMNGLFFREGRYAWATALPSHFHEEARLVLSLQGTTKHLCRKQTEIITPATLLYIPAGEPHADYFQEGATAFIIGLEQEWVARYRQACPFIDLPAIYQRDLPNWTALRLYREATTPDNLTPLLLEGLTLELVGQMARSQQTPEAGNIPPRWLLEARDLLHSRFNEDLSMEEIATAVGVHPSHLMRAFRQHYHASIGDYVRGLRVEYACHLLSTSDLSPAQIAHLSGFAHQSHFCRTFKQRTGMTPVAFQKSSARAISRQEMPRSGKTSTSE